MTAKIAIVVESKYVNPPSGDWYIDQVILENKILSEALKKEGFSVERIDWASKRVDWDQFDIILFREIWDYFHRANEFQDFLHRIENHPCVLNSVEQIKWNMDKHYLLDLSKQGIHIPETHFIEKGDFESLEVIHEKLGWTKTVLKPCVSGGGRHTYLLDPTNYTDHEITFQQLIQNEAMMLQPFQEQIPTKGEVSHMVFHGRYTHSVLKKAKAGDYRVQDDFGGTVHAYKASQDEINFAEAVAAACDPLPAYARVDVFWDNNDQLTIGEVELIEPELWFREFPDSASIFASGIKLLV